MAAVYDNPPSHIQDAFIEGAPEDDNEYYDYDENDDSYLREPAVPHADSVAQSSSHLVNATNEASDATISGIHMASGDDARAADDASAPDREQPAPVVPQNASAGPSNSSTLRPPLHVEVPSVSTPVSTFAEPDCPDIGVIIPGFDATFNLFRSQTPALLASSVTLYQESVGDLFKALRKDPLLRDRSADGLNEMTLSIPELELTLREDDSFSSKCTLQELTILHMGFLQGKPVTFLFGESRRFKPRFLALSKEIEERALRGEWGPEYQPAVIPEPEPASARPSEEKSSPKSALRVEEQAGREAQVLKQAPHEPDSADGLHDTRTYNETEGLLQVPLHNERLDEGDYEDYDENAEHHVHGQYVQHEEAQYGEDEVYDTHNPYIDDTHNPYPAEDPTPYGEEDEQYGEEQYEEYYDEEYVVEEGKPEAPYVEDYVEQDGYVPVEPDTLDDGSQLVDYDENMLTDYNPEAEDSEHPGDMDAADASDEPHFAEEAPYQPRVAEDEQEEFYDYDEDAPEFTAQQPVHTNVDRDTGNSRGDVLRNGNVGAQAKTPATVQEPDTSQEKYADALSLRDENGQPWAIDGDGDDFGMPSTPPLGNVSANAATHSYDHEDLLAAPIDFDWSTPTMPATRISDQPPTAPLSPTHTAVIGGALRHRSPENPSSPISPSRAGSGGELRKSRRKRSWDEGNDERDYTSEVGEIGANLPVDTKKRLRVQ